MYLRPVLLDQLAICWHSSMVVAIGTVHMTCLPALRAAIDIQAWSGIGELMWTKSTFGSLSTSSYFVYRLSILKCVADLVQLLLVPLADGVDVGAAGASDRSE